MKKEVVIHHVLADGREVDSIDGYEIPDSGPTAAVYRIVAEQIGKCTKREAIAQ